MPSQLKDSHLIQHEIVAGPFYNPVCEKHRKPIVNVAFLHRCKVPNLHLPPGVELYLHNNVADNDYVMIIAGEAHGSSRMAYS